MPLVDLDPIPLQNVERMVPDVAANVAEIYPVTPIQQAYFRPSAGEALDSHVLCALIRLRRRDRDWRGCRITRG